MGGLWSSPSTGSAWELGCGRARREHRVEDGSAAEIKMKEGSTKSNSGELLVVYRGKLSPVLFSESIGYCAWKKQPIGLRSQFWLC